MTGEPTLILHKQGYLTVSRTWQHTHPHLHWGHHSSLVPPINFLVHPTYQYKWLFSASSRKKYTQFPNLLPYTVGDPFHSSFTLPHSLEAPLSTSTVAVATKEKQQPTYKRFTFITAPILLYSRNPQSHFPSL